MGSFNQHRKLLSYLMADLERSSLDPESIDRLRYFLSKAEYEIFVDYVMSRVWECQLPISPEFYSILETWAPLVDIEVRFVVPLKELIRPVEPDQRPPSPGA